MLKVVVLVHRFESRGDLAVESCFSEGFTDDLVTEMGRFAG